VIARIAFVLALTSGAARAEDAPPPAAPAPVMPIPATPPDGLPGSQGPPGLGMSPEAPPVTPAPGGRAPSFGAPTPLSAATFRIGGRFFGWEAVGVGRTPGNPPTGYDGWSLHAPAQSIGKVPFWGGAGATLNLQYGTPVLSAFVTYYVRLNQPEYQGYANPAQGPGFGLAYLLWTPSPIRTLRLQFRIGGFTEIYAGPGQWGWGVFGPMLALRGFGETSNADWDLTRDLRLTLTHGLLTNPGVPEAYPRGDYNSWIETGTSSYVNHAHVGLTYKNQYILKLHYASAYGTDERKVLLTFLNTPPADGRMDTYMAELRFQGDPWGQIGLSGGFYNFDHAASVGNGVWWAVDWTQGAREMINKYLGPLSNGNGKVAVVGAEWDFSVSRMLWFPRSFTGQAPDLRVALAAMLVKTLSTDDPYYRGHADAYLFGAESEYRMTSKFSATFAAYGEDRFSSLGLGRWWVYSANPGIAYHSNWLSLDRIQLIYSRRWYSGAADNNSAQPLDHHMIAFGGYVTF
jgi:hypothetical protein